MLHTECASWCALVNVSETNLYHSTEPNRTELNRTDHSHRPGVRTNEHVLCIHSRTFNQSNKILIFFTEMKAETIQPFSFETSSRLYVNSFTLYKQCTSFFFQNESKKSQTNVKKKSRMQMIRTTTFKRIMKKIKHTRIADSFIFRSDLIRRWKLQCGNARRIAERNEPRKCNFAKNKSIQSISAGMHNINNNSTVIRKCTPLLISSVDKMGIHKKKKIGGIFQVVIKIIEFNSLSNRWEKMAQASIELIIHFISYIC